MSAAVFSYRKPSYLTPTIPEVIRHAYRTQNNEKYRIFEGHGTIFRDFELLKGGTCLLPHVIFLFISFYASFIIYPSLLDPFGHLHPASCSTHGVFPF